ncbi:MAG: cupin domain-containing protein [Cyanobacteria bacterium SZAS LIN-3]|nr:cupin domain-containing protein [Cyanobacteria bacterium SZAS LIN-3]MBS2011165.1 cupin domain-containing protein [Cyanobacteria bacterium SZAS TMP-1]
MYDYLSDCVDCVWEKLSIDGVESKTIFESDGDHHKTVLTRLAPGATIPRHHHTHANETVYVLSGDFVEEGKAYGPGSYFVGKAGTSHGPHHSESGCVVLTHWTGGPMDFVVD